MKVYDILHEGVTFHAAEIETDDKGRKIITPHGWRKEKVDCFICDGKGHNIYGDEKEECGYCEGKGKTHEHVSDSPELQVSNSNARSIIEDIFGKHYDYSGVVEPREFAALRQKLIGMINSEDRRSSMHKNTTDNVKSRKMVRKGTEQTVAHIGHDEPRMVDMGRNDEQVLRYAQRMLDMIEYAQKHNLIISWA